MAIVGQVDFLFAASKNLHVFVTVFLFFTFVAQIVINPECKGTVWFLVV